MSDRELTWWLRGFLAGIIAGSLLVLVLWLSQY